jgi:hypothetical protein
MAGSWALYKKEPINCTVTRDANLCKVLLLQEASWRKITQQLEKTHSWKKVVIHKVLIECPTKHLSLQILLQLHCLPTHLSPYMAPARTALHRVNKGISLMIP